MKKVYEYDWNGLYYCGQDEYEEIKQYFTNFSVLFCAKNPYHKQLVGYDKNCPKDHPEYLVAYRPEINTMALNMVDAKESKYFSDEMIMSGIEFIENELAKGRNVVVVCNKGESRSPTMCLMYMMVHGDFERDMSHSEVLESFEKIAPEWKPREGILQYCIQFWDKVKRGEI